MSPINPFAKPTPTSAAAVASTTAKLAAESAGQPTANPAATSNPAPTPTPAAVTPPIQVIPLQCTVCGNALSRVYTAATKTFTHVHQVANNAPKCPVTGKKFHINANHDVEEVNG